MHVIILFNPFKIKSKLLFFSISYLYFTPSQTLSHIHSHSLFSPHLFIFQNPKSVCGQRASSQQIPQVSQIIHSSSSSNEERYAKPSRMLLTPIDSLEVLCELIVDFINMKENGYDLTPDVEFQGWTKYFDRLISPVFPKLVKEFWIHATTSNHQVTSYVIGKKTIITEDLIGKLIGHDGDSIRRRDMEEKDSDLTIVSKEIFSSG